MSGWSSAAMMLAAWSTWSCGPVMTDWLVFVDTTFMPGLAMICAHLPRVDVLHRDGPTDHLLLKIVAIIRAPNRRVSALRGGLLRNHLVVDIVVCRVG